MGASRSWLLNDGALLMCGRFSISLPAEEVARYFQITGRLPNFPPRYNVAPTRRTRWRSTRMEGPPRLIAPAAARVKPIADPDGDLRRLEFATIELSLANLMTFPCIRILVERGRLHLHGAYLALLVRDPKTGEFRKLVEEVRAGIA
jgi:hypothetical protein